MSDVRTKAIAFWMWGILIFAWIIPPVSEATTPPLATNPATDRRHVVASMTKAPLAFEVNQGQTDKSVNFIARGRGYTLFLTPTESVMVLEQRETKERVGDRTVRGPLSMTEPTAINRSVMRMKLEGANPAPAIEGMQPLPGIVNYFLGKDPDKWRTNIPTYAKVRYTEAYPGIDIAYYGNQGKLEYDFIVAPGADPKQIKLAFEGASDIRVTERGELLLSTTSGEVRMHKPLIYQLEQDGRKTQVDGRYIVASHIPKEVGFQIDAYDRKKAVVVDPVLDFSTYLGGTSGEADPDIVVDTSGNAYVTGTTHSLNFPVTAGVIDPTFNANPSCPSITVTNTTCLDPIYGVNLNVDVFVAKLSPTGTALVYATYLGGTGVEMPRVRIAVDSGGQAYITGETRSTNFPVTSGAYRTALHSYAPNCLPPTSCSADAFVSKLNATGSTLLYSTYLGGNSGAGGTGIAVDAGGFAYVAVSSAAGPTCGSATVLKLNQTGTGLVWSTCLSANPSSNFYQADAIALDSGGNVILAGGVAGPAITTANAVQPTYGGGFSDAFVWKLNSSGSALLFGTFLGGSGGEWAYDVAIDAGDAIYITGQTDSTNFPTTPGTFDTTPNGLQDIFVAKLSPAGSLQYATYLGGSGYDCSAGTCAIGVDSLGQAYVAADTNSPNFPVSNAITSSLQGSYDATFSVLNPTGSQLISSTYLGGSGQEIRVRMSVLPSGIAYLAGYTDSTNFPVTSGVLQPTNAGGGDIFVLRISSQPIAKVGPDQTVTGGTLVTLNGSGSYDQSGKPLTYSWTQVAGPPVTLTAATTAIASFTAPQPPIGGVTLTFQLSVSNGSQTSTPVTANVTVKYVNHPPVANAGPNQTVGAGSLVTLDGSSSYDPDSDVLSYQWLQTGGPTVSLSSSTAMKPTFLAPPVSSGSVALTFQLTVSDGSLTSIAQVTITDEHVNHPPVADAGANQTVNDTKLVTLNGSASSDPDNDPLTYAWSQLSGTPVTLSNSAAVKPTFTAPIVSSSGDTLVFQLTVTDPGLLSSTTKTSVTVIHQNPVCTAARPSQAVLWPPDHKLTLVQILGVTDPDNLSTTITVTAVTQDEPVNGLGDGDTSPDAVIQGQGVLLRAERAGTGNGRLYQVAFTATDSKGGTCNGRLSVSVPHDKQGAAIDNGLRYNSFQP